MIIIHKIDNFLFNLFPKTKQIKGFYDECRKYQKNDMELEAHQLIQIWAKELKVENYFSIIEENEYRSSRANDDTFPAETEFNSKASFPLVGNQSFTVKKDSGQAGVTDAERSSIPTLEKGGKGGFEQIILSPLAGEGKGEGDLNLKTDPAGQMAVTMYCLSALQYFQDKELEEIKKVGFEIAMLGRQGIDPAKAEKKYHLESIPGKEFTGLQLLAYMYSAFQVINPFLDTGLDYKKEYEAAKGMLEKRE